MASYPKLEGYKLFYETLPTPKVKVAKPKLKKANKGKHENVLENLEKLAVNS
jgi:hypothetical protein